MPSKEEALAIELAFWEAAKDSRSCIELEAYLERYAEGEFVELAQARLENLREPATDFAARIENSLRVSSHSGTASRTVEIRTCSVPLSINIRTAYAELARINIDVEEP
jgi:hypothetical protein